MVRLLKVFVFIAVLTGMVGGAGVGLYVWSLAQMNHQVELSQPVVIDIPMGTSLCDVVNLLADQDVLKHPELICLHARRLGYGARIQAGTFRLEGRLTPLQTLDMLTIPPQRPQVKVTIPEGITVWQVAAAVEEVGVTQAKPFLDLALSSERASKRLGYSVISLEGYLFPDTYHFHPDTDPEKVVKTLQEQFEKRWQEAKEASPESYQDLTGNGKFTDHELVIIASMVEKEARTARDRRLVSRVIHNRLKAGWTLDIDPTCVYGPDTWHLVPTRSRCRDSKNRWSTYVISGLPPGPISNPGKDALVATLNPDRSPEAMGYFFFVLKPDGSGEHHFSSTIAEHNRAVQRYVRGLRRRSK